jgi:hypothetical protein
MAIISHINLADANNEIYCCLRNRVVNLDEAHLKQYCSGCKMFGGEAEGSGVECVWEDQRPIESPYFAVDAQREWLANQKRKVRLNLSMTEQRRTDRPAAIKSF